MGLRISTAARDATGDALTALLDVDGQGSILVYTGAQPASPQADATGTLLVSFELSSPAYEDFTGGVAALAAVADVDAVATGNAGWFRMVDGSGVPVIDGTAGVSGTQLVLNTASLVAGGNVSILSGQLTMPMGA